ncbi:MAG TPA: cytochrome c biogenesis protein ResB [Mycobacteriales bacterium]|nr:cytochrome c biogenesis protein ResB [Mycobacteriales bacterium]
MSDTVLDDDRTTALSTQPDAPVRAPVRTPLAALRQLWRQLTSMRTALLLLALLALAAIPGTVIPQRGLDPVKVNSFLAAHPHLGPLMDKLSLFDVFAAPWFAAIYLLLALSLVGCLVPRIRLHARALRRRPPNAPRNLTRLTASTQWDSDEPAADVAARVHQVLRGMHWRADVREEPDGVVTVAAEKGYLRETGNLVFHVALLLLLVGIALSGLYGYKGTVLVGPGQGFANARLDYDVFEPSRLFSNSQLSPFSFSLQNFTATYQSNGEPTAFNAYVSYKSSPSAVARPFDIRVNHPLNVKGAKIFLVGHGYSLLLKVTNRKGQVEYDGQTPFLPDNSQFASHGVVKIPSLGGKDGQLGLTGEFYPTAVPTTAGLVSTYPGLDNPMLSLAAWRGNLGLNSGVPQSDYSLPVGGLKNIGVKDLTKGESWKLPDGATVTFEGIDQWATFQVAHEPGKRTVLAAAVLIIAGLLGSLRVRRRRFWIRAVPAAAGDPAGRTVVTAAGLARSDVGGFVDELDDLMAQIGPSRAGDAGTERD